MSSPRHPTCFAVFTRNSVSLWCCNHLAIESSGKCGNADNYQRPFKACSRGQHRLLPVLGWNIRYIPRHSSFSQIENHRWPLNFATLSFAKIHIATVGSRRSPSAKAECVLRTHIGVQIAPLHFDNRPAKNQSGDRSRQLSVIRSLGLIARFGWLLPSLARSRLPRPGPLRSISWSHQP